MFEQKSIVNVCPRAVSGSDTLGQHIMYNSVEITSKDLKKPDLLAVTFLNLTTPQIRLATAVEKIMKTSSSFCVN